MNKSRKVVKSAGLGTTLGILGGLTSGRGDDTLRSAGRGAIKGLGVDVGVGLGAGLGGALGAATLNPGMMALGLVGGGVGGGVLGHSLASSAIGPYETEEEKFERMLSAREGAKEKMKTAYAFGAKVAQSSCTPCDMPNSPSNKKKMTGASPAVLDASQKSEEIGKPDVTETEHSEAKAKLPEEGAKSAYVFGRKVAEDLQLPDPHGFPPLDAGPSMASQMEQLRQQGMKNRGGSPGLMANLPVSPAPRKPNSASVTFAPTAEPGSREARNQAANIEHARRTGRLNIGPPAAVAPPAPSAAPAAPISREARIQAANIEHAKRTGRPAPPAAGGKVDPGAVVNAALGPVPEGDLKPGTTPPPPPGDKGEGGVPWGMIGGGLGAAGLGALLYHLANQPKKKRRDEEDA